MLTISCNDRTIQAARDLRRSLVQTSAQSRVRSEIESGCSGFHPPGTLKLSRMETAQALWAATSWLSWWRKVSPYIQSLHCSSVMSSLLSQASFLIHLLVFLQTRMVLCLEEVVSKDLPVFQSLFALQSWFLWDPTFSSLKKLLSWSPWSVVCYLCSSSSSVSLSPLFQSLHNQDCLWFSLPQTVWMLCE